MKSWNASDLTALLPGDDLYDLTLASPAYTSNDISLHRGARRTVDLNAITDNFASASRLSAKPIIAVVKARAYGGGLVPVANCLSEAGCTAFAVESLGAAVALRKGLDTGGPQAANRPVILVLGFVPPDGLQLARDYEISITITDPDAWQAYRVAITEMWQSGEDQLRIHIKLDTGMNRVGVPVSLEAFGRAVELAKDIDACPGARVEGLFTHFPLGDEVRATGSDAETITLRQIQITKAVLNALNAEGVEPWMVHVANSSAIEQYPESHDPAWITHVRAGALLHGVSILDPRAFRRPTRWEATLTRVEQMPTSMGVGYGHTYTAWRGQHIGTVSVGYADGFLPALAGHTNWMRVGGVPVPVVGSVAMDMCMVDLEPYVRRAGHPPEPGTVIEIMSDDFAGDLLSMESIATRWGLSWPIVLCGIRTRNTSVYSGPVDGGSLQMPGHSPT